MSSHSVPFFDLEKQHSKLEAELQLGFNRVLRSGEFTGGDWIDDFENAFADWMGVDYAVALGSGTEALWLALTSHGITQGDEVITTPMTFAASVEAIVMSGAKPVFVDVDPVTLNLDPHALEGAITDKTRAVVPVHLHGQPADMPEILACCRKFGLIVIEDACQAHGAKIQGLKAGGIGDAGCFSFYPSKNLGAIGDSGMLVTQKRDIAESAKRFRNHGQSGKNQHAAFGWNCRMDSIQASVLSTKLPFLDAWVERRRSLAELYRNELSNLEGLTLPAKKTGASHAYHLFVIQSDYRDDLAIFLNSKGIETRIHYPIPVHLQPAYQSLGYHEGDFPCAEKAAKTILSLPIYPEIPENHVHQVSDSIKMYLTNVKSYELKGHLLHG